MRKVRMCVKWIVEEIIEVELNEPLEGWTDEGIVDELKYSHLYGGKIEPRVEGAEVDEVYVAGSTQMPDRRIKAIWDGDDD
jgi:hypothetical protein